MTHMGPGVSTASYYRWSPFFPSSLGGIRCSRGLEGVVPFPGTSCYILSNYLGVQTRRAGRRTAAWRLAVKVKATLPSRTITQRAGIHLWPQVEPEFQRFLAAAKHFADRHVTGKACSLYKISYDAYRGSSTGLPQPDDGTTTRFHE